MILTSLILVCGFLFASGHSAAADYSHEEAATYGIQDVVPGSDYQTSTCEMLQRHGKEYEIHNVTTRDGYNLQLHRIPFKRSLFKRPKGVVFLMHGLQSSSADWVVMGPGKGLAFVLADKGYDVWMGNARGNKYSRTHQELNPDEDKSYWDFSWHEIGTIDLPTMIDYVLKETRQSKLIYFGHSQGTTSFFVMASELPQYNDKIKMMHAFAPVVYMKHADNLFLRFAARSMNKPAIGKLLGDGEFLPSSDFISKLGDITCKDESISQAICKNTYFIFAGYDPSNLNKTALPDIMQNVPAGCATKQIIHYAQEANYGLISIGKKPKFEKFDYGTHKNTIEYGQESAPEYSLEKVTCPVALYVGESDNLASPQDVKHLHKVLPNVVSHFTVPHKKWLHVDFVWGANIDTLLYEKVFEVMNI